jgi:hypothetical protein
MPRRGRADAAKQEFFKKLLCSFFCLLFFTHSTAAQSSHHTAHTPHTTHTHVFCGARNRERDRATTTHTQHTQRDTRRTLLAAFCPAFLLKARQRAATPTTHHHHTHQTRTGRKVKVNLYPYYIQHSIQTAYVLLSTVYYCNGTLSTLCC